MPVCLSFLVVVPLTQKPDGSPGQGNPLVAYIPEKVEPELMYKLFTAVCCSFDEVVNNLEQI